MNPITTDRLILRNWEERERGLFHRINCDEKVMEFFPFRRDRAASDALFDRLRDEISRLGYGFAAAELKSDGACIGFIGLRPAVGIPSLPDGTVEIGWRLAPEFWGKSYATEAACAWLSFGFETLHLEEIVSFAVWNNARSIAVMRRIGMREIVGGDFDHPGVPDTHPWLKRHVLYRIASADWRRSVHP
ncbi:GNAT family N-acetyltransferase [Chelativorans oligotrophicus]|uniref:GNAT family N-acetyltransferase n=1 Tax=Chelativorans oligotrophicus TaxID=449974 RepID=UPI0014084DD0|nr:GNAT family N-acetyltransferase [Chelativorans oligotrophicus]